MAHWTLDDIPWERFEPQKLDPELLRIVKAASLVEQATAPITRAISAASSPTMPASKRRSRGWGDEEIQHGLALGRYAHLADPSFDHADACARFTAGYRVDLEATASVRGSRAGELVARCIVETGTSSYYTALAEATDEPVLKAICQRIAADELRHYKLFYAIYAAISSRRLGTWGRLKIALGRIRESEDDELAFAYHAANDPGAPMIARARSAPMPAALTRSIVATMSSAASPWC